MLIYQWRLLHMFFILPANCYIPSVLFPVLILLPFAWHCSNTIEEAMGMKIKTQSTENPNSKNYKRIFFIMTDKYWCFCLSADQLPFCEAAFFYREHTLGSCYGDFDFWSYQNKSSIVCCLVAVFSLMVDHLCVLLKKTKTKTYHC